MLAALSSLFKKPSAPRSNAASFAHGSGANTSAARGTIAEAAAAEPGRETIADAAAAEPGRETIADAAAAEPGRETIAEAAAAEPGQVFASEPQAKEAEDSSPLKVFLFLVWDAESVAIPRFGSVNSPTHAADVMATLRASCIATIAGSEGRTFSGRRPAPSPEAIVVELARAYSVPVPSGQHFQWLQQAGIQYFHVPNPRNKPERVDMEIIAQLAELERPATDSRRVLAIFSSDADYMRIVISNLDRGFVSHCLVIYNDAQRPDYGPANPRIKTIPLSQLLRCEPPSAIRPTGSAQQLHQPLTAAPEEITAEPSSPPSGLAPLALKAAPRTLPGVSNSPAPPPETLYPWTLRKFILILLRNKPAGPRATISTLGLASSVVRFMFKTPTLPITDDFIRRITARHPPRIDTWIDFLRSIPELVEVPGPYPKSALRWGLRKRHITQGTAALAAIDEARAAVVAYEPQPAAFASPCGLGSAATPKEAVVAFEGGEDEGGEDEGGDYEDGEAESGDYESGDYEDGEGEDDGESGEGEDDGEGEEYENGEAEDNGEGEEGEGVHDKRVLDSAAVIEATVEVLRLHSSVSAPINLCYMPAHVSRMLGLDYTLTNDRLSKIVGFTWAQFLETADPRISCCIVQPGRHRVAWYSGSRRAERVSSSEGEAVTDLMRSRLLRAVRSLIKSSPQQFVRLETLPAAVAQSIKHSSDLTNQELRDLGVAENWTQLLRSNPAFIVQRLHPHKPNKAVFFNDAFLSPQSN
jgi:hypothetical protein